MLPVKAENYLGKIVNWGYQLGFSQYCWDKKKRQFEYVNTERNYYKFLFKFSVLVMYEGFVLFRCLQTIRNPEETRLRQIRVVYKAFAFIILNVNHVVTLQHFGAYHRLIENFLHVTRRFQSNS